MKTKLLLIISLFLIAYLFVFLSQSSGGLVRTVYADEWCGASDTKACDGQTFYGQGSSVVCSFVGSYGAANAPGQWKSQHESAVGNCQTGGGNLTNKSCSSSIAPSYLGVNDATVCDRLHKYVPVDGSGNEVSCGSAKVCSKKEDCPQNTSQTNPPKVVPETSNWCFGFKDGAKCIQLKYTGTAAEPGCSAGEGSGGPNGCTNLDACSKCVLTARPDVLDNYAKWGWDTKCSNMPAIVNDWCRIDSAGCQSVKSGTCASSCSGSGSPAPSSPAGSSPNPGGGGNPPSTVSCTISGPNSVERGKKATYKATRGNNDVKWMEIYYVPSGSLDDKNAWNAQGVTSCDATAVGDCTREIDTNTVPVDKEQFVVACNAYSWKPTVTGTGSCTEGNTDVIHCRPASGPIDACTGNPLWFPKVPDNWKDSLWNSGSCGAKSFINTVKLTAPPPPPVTTKKYRIAESKADLNTTDWLDYAPGIEQKMLPFEFKDQKPGVKTVFVEFWSSDDKKGGCGDNKTQPCQAQIKLLGDNPKITSCSLSFEENNAIATLKGQNFGSDKGKAKSKDKDMQISEWKNDSVKVVWQNAPAGEALPIALTNTDDQSSEESQCSAISQLSVGAKFFCGGLPPAAVANADLVLAGAFEGGPRVKQKVNINTTGIIQGLSQKLEEGKKYKISLKIPRSVRRTNDFVAGNGTTTVGNFNLPLGDIFPVNVGDGVINTMDKAELNRQWLIGGSATGRSGDFNGDGRVNSIDWACMRNSFGNSDDSEPTAGAPAASPSPSPSSPAGVFCGGIANVKCPGGYTCELESDMPDAGGKCVVSKEKK